MQLRIDTTHANVLGLGHAEVYTHLPFGDEGIEITCLKTNCLEDGTLVAMVNSNLAARRKQCAAYAGNWSHEYKCLRQTFEYTLFRNDMGEVYDIVCRIDENEAITVDFQIVKLCKNGN